MTTLQTLMIDLIVDQWTKNVREEADLLRNQFIGLTWEADEEVDWYFDENDEITKAYGAVEHMVDEVLVYVGDMELREVKTFADLEYLANYLSDGSLPEIYFCSEGIQIDETLVLHSMQAITNEEYSFGQHLENMLDDYIVKW
jgi:hypothetical protein